jgi:hypothetical protein
MAKRARLPGYTRLPGSSKRIRTPDGSIISERQYEKIRTGLTKEKATQKRKRKELAYVSPEQAIRTQHARYRKELDQFVPQMSPKDRRLYYKVMGLKDAKYKHPTTQLTDKEKKQFVNLFPRYGTRLMKEAFGSQINDLGSFSIAA